MGRLDFLVLGATGITGRIVVQKLAKIVNNEGFSWAIVGRNPAKLEAVKSSVVGSRPQILHADIDNFSSLQDAVGRGKIVLNCVGPYALHGEKVIRACLDTSTHHIDVSGEPLFLEKSQLQFFDEALHKKVYVIGSCGFDSIPADLGTAILKQEHNNIKLMETYLHLQVPKGCKFNYATWESLVLGKSNYRQLTIVRRELFKKVKIDSVPRHNLRIMNGKYVVPFLGSDRSVAKRTQALQKVYQNIQPVPIETYYTTDSLSQLLGLVSANLFLSLLSSYKFGRELLLKQGEFFSLNKFSRKPSSQELLSKSSFELFIEAHLLDGKKVKMRVTGPEPGYTAASICCTQAALTLMKESDRIPLPGGVFTPGFCFSNTTLMSRLQKNGVKFERCT